MIDDFDPDKLGAIVPKSQTFVKTPNSTNDDPQYTTFQVRESPWGPIVEGLNPDGSKIYKLPNEGDSRTYLQQDDNGKWQEKTSTNKGYGGMMKDVLADKKFMTFVAIAAGGAALSAYAGGGTMASGAVAEGGLPASAGGSGILSSAAPISTAIPSAGGGSAVATPVTTGSVAPGLSAAETASINGAGVIEPGSLAAGGYSLPASTAAAPAAYSDLAGLEGLSQSGLTTAGSIGVGTGETASGLAGAGSFWDTLLGGAKKVGQAALDNPQITAGIVTGVGQGIAAYQNNQAELDNAQAEREWKVRNFTLSNMPKIQWTPKAKEPLTTFKVSKPAGILSGARRG